MFMGEYSHNIDAKGRLIVPAKLREELGTEFVVTEGADGCLYGYSKEGWQSVNEAFLSTPMSGKMSRELKRRVFSKASNVEIDKQGRILLSPKHREFAGLKKEVVFLGVLDRIEIWDKARLDECENKVNEDELDEILETLSEKGLNF